MEDQSFLFFLMSGFEVCRKSQGIVFFNHCRRGRADRPGVLQQQQERQHQQEHDSHHPERFHKAEHGRMCLHQAVHRRESFSRGGVIVGSVRVEKRLQPF